MNLIEQLGGYAQAKALRALPVTTYDCGIKFNREELELSMLEHRRQHNIFEVGDKVVLLGDGTWGHLFEVEKMSPKGRKPTKLKTNVFGNFHVGYNVVRHATPEEIKAGRRL